MAMGIEAEIVLWGVGIPSLCFVHYCHQSQFEVDDIIIRFLKNNS